MTMHWTEWEEKVLRTFLDGDRLRQIPARWKKREVILRWLIERFEPGVAYSEHEVNRILQAHHPDSATLRREFVVHGFMERTRSTYRRPRDSERPGPDATNRV